MPFFFILVPLHVVFFPGRRRNQRQQTNWRWRRQRTCWARILSPIAVSDCLLPHPYGLLPLLTTSQNLINSSNSRSAQADRQVRSSGHRGGRTDGRTDNWVEPSAAPDSLCIGERILLERKDRWCARDTNIKYRIIKNAVYELFSCNTNLYFWCAGIYEKLAACIYVRTCGSASATKCNMRGVLACQPACGSASSCRFRGCVQACLP